MRCPTCSGLMDYAGGTAYHCGECGTLAWLGADRAVVPALVRRCRGYAQNLQPPERSLWRGLGIESVIEGNKEKA